MALKEVPAIRGVESVSAGTACIVAKPIRDLLEYWQNLRQGRLLPQRGAIDPIDVPWALSRIFIMDIDPTTRQFHYRLAGAEVSSIFGRSNLKGLDLYDILAPEKADIVIERWRPLWEKPAIVHMRGLIYLAAERGTLGERILLPLADEEGAVAGILGYTHHEWEEPQPDQDLRMARVNVIELAIAA